MELTSNQINQLNEEDNQLVLSRLAGSRPAVLKFAEYLHLRNFAVFPGYESKPRPGYKYRNEQQDRGDLLYLGKEDTLDKVRMVQVKHRPKINFTGLDDWEYPDMYVCATHSLDLHPVKPKGFVVVDADLSHFAWIPYDTRPTWRVARNVKDGSSNLMVQDVYASPLTNATFYAFGF